MVFELSKIYCIKPNNKKICFSGFFHISRNVEVFCIYFLFHSALSGLNFIFLTAVRAEKTTGWNEN